MVTLTERAQEKILELRSKDGRPGLALRFGATGRAPGGLVYQLAFSTLGERRPDDVAVDGGGFDLLIDRESVPKVRGASIDYVETLEGTGFKIENPNAVWNDPVAAKVQQLLDQEINPAVASHGGMVTLLDVREGVAYIEMSGGCQGCGMAQVTLRQGVEVRIKQEVPAIREVIDTTDHAGGSNPYYRGASGDSPLA